jgi:hypothetical protein
MEVSGQLHTSPALDPWVQCLLGGPQAILNIVVKRQVPSS